MRFPSCSGRRLLYGRFLEYCDFIFNYVNNFLDSPFSGYLILGIFIGMLAMAYFNVDKKKEYSTDEEDAREKNPFIPKN